MTDTTSAGGSSANDDEPAPLEDDLSAELAREVCAFEHPLVDRPARAVLQQPVVPALGRVVRTPNGCDDHELGRDALRFGDKTLAVSFFQMAIEVTREDAVECAILERK